MAAVSAAVAESVALPVPRRGIAVVRVPAPPSVDDEIPSNGIAESSAAVALAVDVVVPNSGIAVVRPADPASLLDVVPSSTAPPAAVYVMRIWPPPGVLELRTDVPLPPPPPPGTPPVPPDAPAELIQPPPPDPPSTLLTPLPPLAAPPAVPPLLAAPPAAPPVVLPSVPAPTGPPAPAPDVRPLLVCPAPPLCAPALGVQLAASPAATPPFWPDAAITEPLLKLVAVPADPMTMGIDPPFVTLMPVSEVHAPAPAPLLPPAPRWPPPPQHSTSTVAASAVQVVPDVRTTWVSSYFPQARTIMWPGMWSTSGSYTPVWTSLPVATCST